MFLAIGRAEDIFSSVSRSNGQLQTVVTTYVIEPGEGIQSPLAGQSIETYRRLH